MIVCKCRGQWRSMGWRNLRGNCVRPRRSDEWIGSGGGEIVRQAEDGGGVHSAWGVAGGCDRSVGGNRRGADTVGGSCAGVAASVTGGRSRRDLVQLAIAASLGG